MKLDNFAKLRNYEFTNLGGVVTKLLFMVMFGVFMAGCSHVVRMPTTGELGDMAKSASENITAGESKEEVESDYDYTKAKFDAARASGKTILLYFYANWCPICREQIPDNDEAYARLSEYDDVVIMVSNFNDSEENNEDKQLARDLKVGYQHTFIVITADGGEGYRFTGRLSADQIVEQVLEARGQ